MNGLNNDIPSPVEEGVVDWFKKKIGNKSNTSYDDDGNPINWFYIDFKALEKVLVKFDGTVKKAINDPAYKGIKPGFRKMSSSEYYIENNRHEELGTGLNTFKTKKVRDIEYKIGIYEIRYDKIFPKEEYLDLTPGAERGDISDAGRKFWKLVEDFQYLVSRYCQHTLAIGLVGADVISVNDWDDDPIVWVAAVIKPKEIGKDTIKEATQEELFPILTGKELPVNEMSDGKAGAIALATTIGIAGLGCGVLAVIGKGIEKLFGSHKSSSSGTVSRNDIEKIKRLSQQFMDTQQINSSERRKVFGEAYGLLKKHFDPMYFKTKAIEQGTEWNDPADFYSGKINIIEFAFTQSEHQSLVGDDKIDSNLPNDEYWKEYDKLAKKWIADVTKAANAINKELSKKYNGKYRIFFEELDGGYWDYFGEGDGDEGAVVIVDVDMIDRMKSYIKNHAVEESSTEVATKAEPVEEGIMSTIKTGLAGTAFVGAGLALWGIPIYFGYKALNKLGDKMEQDRMHKQHKAIEDKEKLIKKEAENSPFYDERSAAFKEALKIITKLFTAKFKDKNWLDPEPRADYFFLAGRTNMTFLGFVPSTLKSQGIPGEDEYIAKLKKSGKYDYDELDEDGTDYNLEPYYDEYNKFLDKLESDTNKKLSKMFGGKFSILISDNHNIEEFASDDYDYPGFVLLVDKTRLKNGEKFIDFNNINNFLRESTEVATEGISNGALAAGIIGAFWGTAAIGYGLYKILNPDLTYDKPSQISPIAKAKMDKIKEMEEVSKEFMKTQDVDSSERRKVVAEAISLVKKHYPKDLDKRYDFAQKFGEYGSDAEDFYKGNCNLLSIGHTPSKWQEFHGSYELDLDTPAYEKAQKNWSATIAKCEAAVNKDLSKKFKGKYKVFFEEVEKGGWWEYCWTGDGDEGLVIVVDVDMINKLKDYIKNKSSVKESTEIIYEGWGIAFTRFAVKHNLPFANKLEDKIWEWSESTVNQLTNIPEFKEYILREAPKAYDEAYLRNNNLSINVNADMISEFEEEYEDSEAYHKVDKKNCCFCKKIGKFYVGVFGDKSHIHGVWLLMSDSKNKKIYAKALPAPEKELNKFKYQK